MVVGGKFVLTRLLGEGGLATVFEARHATLGRRVAIKVLNERFAANAEAVGRLQREAITASSIEHPNIVEIFDIAQDAVEGSFFIVQRLMQGMDLRDYLQQRPRPGLVETLDLLVPVMGALDAAHRAGIIHRDIKPENVFLAQSASGALTPTLIDFGIAKQQSVVAGAPDLTRVGSVLGTPYYVAPEQALAQPVDGRVDVWALGVVLYEMLSGRLPFDGPNAQMIMMRVAYESPPPLESLVALPRPVRDVVHRALERDRARRFASMREMLRALLTISLEGDDRAAYGPLGAPLAERHRASLGTLPSELDSRPAHAAHAATVRAAAYASVPPPGLSRSAPAPLSSIFDDEEPPLSVDDVSQLRGSLRPSQRSEASREIEPWPTKEPDAVAEAYRALQLNALEDCAERAQQALAGVGNDADLIGKLQLLQATARAWLGQWKRADKLARDALDHLVPGTAGALNALGLRITIASQLGQHDALTTYAAALRSGKRLAVPAIPFVVTACRLATAQLRAGRPDEAAAWLALASERAEGIDEREVVDGWLLGVRAERAANAGDVGEALGLWKASAAAFGEAGDSRNACRQRCNVGDQLHALGAYREAVEVTAAALEAAEPMGVYFVGALSANLGRALFRLGMPGAVEWLSAAVAQARAQGNVRAEAFSRAYLAQALGETELAAAEIEARAALELGPVAPSSRAYALAVLAGLALRKAPPDAAAAVPLAREAYRLLGETGGAEGAELLVRATLTSALVHLEAYGEARAVAAAARDRLHEFAARIGDPQLRASFVERVPENASILEWVRWLG
jgi:serine/threonine protein kinase